MSTNTTHIASSETITETTALALVDTFANRTPFITTLLACNKAITAPVLVALASECSDENTLICVAAHPGTPKLLLTNFAAGGYPKTVAAAAKKNLANQRALAAA